MAERWADLPIRLVSALVLVPLALGCVWVGGAAFEALIGVMALGLTVEWVGLVRSPTSSLPPCGGGLGWGGERSDAQPRVSHQRPLSPTLPRKGGGSFLILSSLPCRPLLFPSGLLYIALAAASLLWLRADPIAGRANLLALLLLVWASDVGAYAVGRAIGGPRLAPSISPGKTVSGACGGLLAAIAAGLLVAAAVSPHASPLRAALFAAGLGIVAQAGDLLESWVKRRLGVKDSGSLIPGHGGLFDRLDALLAAAPAAALLALLAGRGLAWWE